MIQTKENDEEPHFMPDLIWSANSFFKILSSSVTRYRSQLSSCTISEKNNDPVLRKVSDKQTDRQTDRGQTQADESNFIGHC